MNHNPSFELPSDEMLAKMQTVEERSHIPLEHAANNWAVNTWNHRCHEMAHVISNETRVLVDTAITFGEDLYKTLRKSFEQRNQIRELELTVAKLEKEKDVLKKELLAIRNIKGN